MKPLILIIVISAHLLVGGLISSGQVDAQGGVGPVCFFPETNTNPNMASIRWEQKSCIEKLPPEQVAPMVPNACYAWFFQVTRVDCEKIQNNTVEESSSSLWGGITSSNPDDSSSSSSNQDTTEVYQAPPPDPLPQNPIFVRLVQIINILSAGVFVVVTITVVVSGIQYTASAGNPQMAASARNKITYALLSLVIYFLMWALLQWIIPGGLIN